MMDDGTYSKYYITRYTKIEKFIKKFLERKISRSNRIKCIDHWENSKFVPFLNYYAKFQFPIEKKLPRGKDPKVNRFDGKSIRF